MDYLESDIGWWWSNSRYRHESDDNFYSDFESFADFNNKSENRLMSKLTPTGPYTNSCIHSIWRELRDYVLSDNGQLEIIE